MSRGCCFGSIVEGSPLAEGTLVEIEAKYSVADPAVFAALLELQALGDYTLRPVGSRDVIDHYLDTPDRDLLRGGYACRLREGEKDGRWLSTVKELGKAGGAVHQREEHECEIPPHATPAEWPEGPAREIVMRLSGGEPLVELFTLRQHRDLRAVEQDGRAVAELSLDTVEMHIGSRTSVTHEMEIELEAGGTMDDLHAIAAALEPYRLKAPGRGPTSRWRRPAGRSCASTMTAWWRKRTTRARARTSRPSITCASPPVASGPPFASSRRTSGARPFAHFGTNCGSRQDIWARCGTSMCS